MKRTITVVFMALLVSLTSFAAVNLDYESPIVNVVEIAAPGVVNIEVTRASAVKIDPFTQYFFERFFGLKIPEYQTKGLGSGFIFHEDGYVLTNYHVVEKAKQITVTLSNGKKYDAELIGGDEDLDLAIIKLNTNEKMHVLELGDSDKVKIGEWVIAIRNPLGLQNTVTVGVISATNRTITKPEGTGSYYGLLQTDASINPGNSGGPLLNIHGEVIGINTAIAVDPQLGNVNIGFAIPINVAKRFALSVMELGTFQRGYLGVRIQDITEDLKKSLGLKVDYGAYVVHVEPGSAAEKSGIQPQDVIIEFDGNKIESSNDLSSLVATYPAGAEVEVVVDRFGERLTFKIKLEGQLVVKSQEYFGIRVRNITEEDRKTYNIKKDLQGVIVEEIVDNKYVLGLKVGDVITEVAVNGVYHDIKNVDDWEKIASSVEKNSYVALIVYRSNVRYVIQFFYR